MQSKTVFHAVLGLVQSLSADRACQRWLQSGRLATRSSIDQSEPRFGDSEADLSGAMASEPLLCPGQLRHRPHDALLL